MPLILAQLNPTPPPSTNRTNKHWNPFHLIMSNTASRQRWCYPNGKGDYLNPWGLWDFNSPEKLLFAWNGRQDGPFLKSIQTQTENTHPHHAVSGRKMWVFLAVEGPFVISEKESVGSICRYLSWQFNCWDKTQCQNFDILFPGRNKERRLFRKCTHSYSINY